MTEDATKINCPECENEGIQRTINGRELCDVCQGESAKGA